MKKLFGISTVIMLALCCAFALCGCGGAGTAASAEIKESGDKFVVIEAKSTGGSLADALEALKKEGKLEYEAETGNFGLYVNSVGGYAADASENEFWAVYTTLGEYEGVTYSSAEYGTYEWNGKTLQSTSYGVSGTVLVEGEFYALAIATF